ncbi:MAG: hypothetical protein WB502_10085 [Thermoactinomyces sp.]
MSTKCEKSIFKQSRQSGSILSQGRTKRFECKPVLLEGNAICYDFFFARRKRDVVLKIVFLSLFYGKNVIA